MKELTKEQYIFVYEVSRKAWLATCRQGATREEKEVAWGRAAYAASFPYAVAEALAQPTDAELDAVEHNWIFDELPTGILYRPSDVAQKVRDAACIFWANRRRALTAKPDPLRKALSRWVSDGDMDEAIAAVRSADGAK